MRFSDSLEERSYPFLGNNSNALAREISFNVLDSKMFFFIIFGFE